jgi:hypothetical protein
LLSRSEEAARTPIIGLLYALLNGLGGSQRPS